ncbi:MAG: hypothetical protein GY940_20660 [bacterium]|nr:hypothetical protein [bacterium]
MDESYRQKMIEDLNELLDIPDVDTYIFLTIEQAKIKFAEEIDNYRQLKNAFHQTKRGTMMIIEDKKPVHQTQSFYFELKRTKPKGSRLKYQWFVSNIKPKTEKERIVPPEFINMIDLHPVDPDKIETYKRFKSRALKKYFDIRFTRYSDSHVMGSIREDQKEIPGENEQDDYGDEPEAFKLNLTRKNFKEDYMELFRYMEEHPEIKEDIFNRFHMVQKPYIDNSKQSG